MQFLFSLDLLHKYISGEINQSNYVYICSVYLDQQLDNKVSPVDLHAVQEKEKNVKGKIESSFTAHQNTRHCSGVHDLHREPVQTAQEPEID